MIECETKSHNTLKVKDIFGKVKLTKPTAQLLKEVDKELDTKFNMKYFFDKNIENVEYVK